jgi:hypothetical protein
MHPTRPTSIRAFLLVVLLGALITGAHAQSAKSAPAENAGIEKPPVSGDGQTLAAAIERINGHFTAFNRQVGEYNTNLAEICRLRDFSAVQELTNQVSLEKLIKHVKRVGEAIVDMRWRVTNAVVDIHCIITNAALVAKLNPGADRQLAEFAETGSGLCKKIDQLVFCR